MSYLAATPSRLVASVLLAAAAAVAIAIAVSPGVPLAHSATHATQNVGSPSFQPVLGLPATNVALIGASPGEAPGETWAQGRVGAVPAGMSGPPAAGDETLLRYTDANGSWQIVPLDDAAGQPLDFEWWGSEVTPAGGVVLAGAEESAAEGSGSTAIQSIVTRDPGGSFAQAVAPSSQAASGSGESPVLEAGEQLYPVSGTAGRHGIVPLIAALDEPGGHTGAFVVPVWADTSSSASTGDKTAAGTGTGAGPATGPVTGTGTGADAATGTTSGTESGPGADESATPLAPGVLHYDGSRWAREPLCTSYTAGTCTPASSALEPLAIAASTPQNAWLLASSSGQLVLFKRIQAPAGDEPASPSELWLQVQFTSGLLSPSGLPAGESASARGGGPMLTVTSQGVWVDLSLSQTGSEAGSATLLASASDAEADSGTDTSTSTDADSNTSTSSDTGSNTSTSPDTGSDTNTSKDTITVTGTVLDTWCYPTSDCPPGTPSLGVQLPSTYESFAWPGSGGDAGARVITGLPDGALLRLQEGATAFTYEAGGGAGGAGNAIGPGGETLGESPGSSSMPSGGAAFASPTEGWLGDDLSSASTVTPQVIRVTSAAGGDRLQSWPVPFRHPLLAVAAQPGTAPGETNAQALAVGVDGQIARYLPGQGWAGEYLYNSMGERQTPNLRGVAWPEPGRAYAVGDDGAMWLWQADSGLWEPDPGEPLGFRGQLTAVAFSPTDPEVGYAVGKQGVLLAYGKSWAQVALPSGLAAANFTSIAFAGNEAIATYRMLSPTPSKPNREVGGLIVEDGSGWQVDPSAQALLDQLPAQDTVLSKVAGLPDGGVVAAGPGLVIERDPGSSSWRLAPEPLPEAGNIAALAAFQEGSTVRALVSLDPADNPNESVIYEEIDNPAGPALGQYGDLLGPDPLPERGYLLRETSAGWQDEEHGAYPRPTGSDLPGWPDAVLALLVNPSGEQGWAVGGQTGEELALYGSPGTQEAIQSAGVMRYGAGPAPPQSTSAPIQIPPGEASFAVGGNAQCASQCAAFTNEQLEPNASLTGAISRSEQIAGLRAFLYTGAHAATGSGVEHERELSIYANLLRSGELPVYAAISPSDVPTGGEAAGGGAGSGAFEQALGALAPAGSVPPGTPAPPAGEAAYAFDSTGTTGTVRVIVLDYSQSELSPHDTAQPSCPSDWSAPANQLQWLCAQLHDAAQSGVPAIVMGNADITAPGAPGDAQDAAAVQRVLLEGGASAYLFDSPEQNLSTRIGSGGECESLPAYGTGTLGYVSPPLHDPQDFLGASGFLTVSVNVAHPCAGANRVPVSASLVPSIGQLGLEADEGTLLRRSHAALFQGLARRPLGGEEALLSGGGNVLEEAPDPYTPIPETCEGANCSQFIQPAYQFTSSNPAVGDFVEQNPDSTNPLAVLQANGKPVPDPASGLFCAYNAGTTTVTLTTGGLSYSEQVTVQAGSIEQPCGTVPATAAPVAEESKSLPAVPPLAPEAEEPTPTTNPSLSLTPPPPPPAAAARATPATPHHHPAPTALPLLAATALPAQVRVALPPPSPQTARPSPPSGTSEVSEPVGVAESEREEEGAVDVVHNAAAYVPDAGALPPGSPLALVVIAAGAGACIGRRRRASRRPKLARVSARVTSR